MCYVKRMLLGKESEKWRNMLLKTFAGLLKET